MIEETAKAWPFAVVRLKSAHQEVVAPAVFVFDSARGFAFVEPGYIDPDNTRNRLHFVEVTTSKLERVPYVRSVPEVFFGELFTFSGPEWSGTVEQYDPCATQLRETGYALEGYETVLAATGRTLAEERASVRASVQDELG